MRRVQPKRACYKNNSTGARWWWQTLLDWQFTSSTSGRKVLSIHNKYLWINKLKVLAETACQKGSDKSTERQLFVSGPKLIFPEMNDRRSQRAWRRKKNRRGKMGKKELISRINRITTGFPLLYEWNVSQTFCRDKSNCGLVQTSRVRTRRRHLVNWCTCCPFLPLPLAFMSLIDSPSKDVHEICDCLVRASP